MDKGPGSLKSARKTRAEHDRYARTIANGAILNHSIADKDNKSYGELEVDLGRVPQDQPELFYDLVQHLSDAQLLSDAHRNDVYVQYGSAAFHVPSYQIPAGAMEKLKWLIEEEIELTGFVLLWLPEALKEGNNNLWQLVQAINQNNHNQVSGQLESIDFRVDRETVEDPDFPVLVENNQGEDSTNILVASFPLVTIEGFTSDFTGNNIRPLILGASNPESKLFRLEINFAELSLAKTLAPTTVRSSLDSIMATLTELPKTASLTNLKLTFSGYDPAWCLTKHFEAIAEHIGNAKSLRLLELVVTPLSDKNDNTVPYKLDIDDEQILIQGLLKNTRLKRASILEAEISPRFQQMLTSYPKRNEYRSSADYIAIEKQLAKEMNEKPALASKYSADDVSVTVPNNGVSVPVPNNESTVTMITTPDRTGPITACTTPQKLVPGPNIVPATPALPGDLSSSTRAPNLASDVATPESLPAASPDATSSNTITTKKASNITPDHPAETAKHQSK